MRIVGPLTAVVVYTLIVTHLVTAQTPSTAPQGATVTRTASQLQADGKPIQVFTLKNGRGIELQAISYGGIITSIKVPDRSGKVADVVLGFDTPGEYLKTPPHPYFGAIVGRYGNRIAKGKFVLDGRTYTLVTNNGPNHLHGGTKGFDKMNWEADTKEGTDGASVVFTRTSPDGEEGYPGNLQVRVTYTLTTANELFVEYHATTDKATPINLTQHSYFNLAGHDAGDILAHEVVINADRYTPVDSTLIPTGELAPVAGTPFDFRQAAAVGARIDQDNAQLKNGQGYDHNWVLSRKGSGLELAARVTDPKSGRMLEIRTTEPGVQFYTGNFLDGSVKGKGGHAYGRRAALCLETQHFPDSPNHPNFPSTILHPGQSYDSKTVFVFK